jgi:hypothetical protein
MHPNLAVAFIAFYSRIVIKAVQIWIMTAFLDVAIKVLI